MGKPKASAPSTKSSDLSRSRRRASQTKHRLASRVLLLIDNHIALNVTNISRRQVASCYQRLRKCIPLKTKKPRWVSYSRPTYTITTVSNFDAHLPHPHPRRCGSRSLFHLPAVGVDVMGPVRNRDAMMRNVTIFNTARPAVLQFEFQEWSVGNRLLQYASKIISGTLPTNWKFVVGGAFFLVSS